MKHQIAYRTIQLTFAALLLFAGSVSGLAQSIHYIRWAGAVSPSTHLSALHAPDKDATTAGAPFTVSRFGSPMYYQKLDVLLRVPSHVLARADVIAFEQNDGGGAGPFGGWESTVFTFSDGMNTRTVSYNQIIGPASDPTVLATGTVENWEYSSAFGMCPSGEIRFSYILFDLDAASPVIDKTDANFSIRLANGFLSDKSFGEGTPDPDAIGIFTDPCP